MTNTFESHPTDDLVMPCYAPPRVDATYLVNQDSYLDIMLPKVLAARSCLRLYEIGENVVHAADLSGFVSIPPINSAEFATAPKALFTAFELNKEFFIGRTGDKDALLPVLERKAVSHAHLGITISMGGCGLLLAIRDEFSKNGTIAEPSNTLELIEDRLYPVTAQSA